MTWFSWFHTQTSNWPTIFSPFLACATDCVVGVTCSSCLTRRHLPHRVSSPPVPPCTPPPTIFANKSISIYSWHLFNNDHHQTTASFLDFFLILTCTWCIYIYIYLYITPLVYPIFFLSFFFCFFFKPYCEW